MVPNAFQIEKRRDVFQAIADPTRRAIISLIAIHSKTPSAIADHFETTRQAVFKHLKILVECELVKTDKRGREIYFQLETKKIKEIDMWLEKLRNQWVAPKPWVSKTKFMDFKVGGRRTIYNESLARMGTIF